MSEFKFHLVLLAGAGGGLGAALRYLTGVLATTLLGAHFPWGTMIVNVVGSFIMGVFISIVALHYTVSNELRTFFAIGLLGGFTTFSSFSLDFVYLYQRKAYLAAGGYLTFSVLLSISALFLGLYAGRRAL